MGNGKTRIFIDTNVLIYSTLAQDHRCLRATKALVAQDGQERFISVQNLAEMYPNLTGPKMEVPDSPAMAGLKIRSIANLPGLQVLPLTAEVQKIALQLCESYGITRQKYSDVQIVATMIAYGIKTIYTENNRDFKGFTEIEAINPFE
jgi:predicted nucleic acid-binding protein